MQERIDSTPFSKDLLVRHLGEITRTLDAPFDEALVRCTIEVFEPEFRDCVVQMKAASKPGSAIYYRFFYNGPLDLTQRAQATGLVPPGDAPLVALQPDILGTLPGSTRAGLDFDTQTGLAKVWTFTGGPVPIDTFLDKIRSVPDAVRSHRDFFKRYGMEHIFFTASDFDGRTCNVYFGWEEPQRNPAWLNEVLAATGSAPLPESCMQDIMGSLAASAGIGTTFSWDSPDLLRWCVYGLDIPYQGPNPMGIRLPQLPDRLDRFRLAAPTLNDTPQYNVAWSFGQAGYYVKLEKAYARDATFFLTTEMGGDLSHAPQAVQA